MVTDDFPTNLTILPFPPGHPISGVDEPLQKPSLPRMSILPTHTERNPRDYSMQLRKARPVVPSLAMQQCHSQQPLFATTKATAFQFQILNARRPSYAPTQSRQSRRK